MPKTRTGFEKSEQKIRKITKQQYERAKRIVSEYETQFSLSFVKGQFSISDLELCSSSISVPKLTVDVFDDQYCHFLEQKLNERVSGVEWANVDDSGHLVVSFRRLVTEEDVQAVIDSLNTL